MAYVKILYQDSPSTATPLNAQNLNHMDEQIALNDQRLTELEGAHVSSFNGRTGVVTPADGDYDIGQIAPLTGAQVGQVPVVTNIGTEEDPELVFRMGAGGGAGGHEIIDSEGNTMPQESAMQFPDSHVSDDSVNGRTIVENVKSVASADYSSETDDGMYLIPDGEGAVIEPASDDYVEVTASSDTMGSLISKLFLEVDWDKVTDYAYLTLNDVGVAYYLASLDRIDRNNDNAIFTRANVSSGGARAYYYYLGSSGQYYIAKGATPEEDHSSESVPNGIILALHYGNKKATVDLQTTANRCWMADGTNIQQRVGNKNFGTRVNIASYTSSANKYTCPSDGYVRFEGTGGVSLELNDVTMFQSTNLRTSIYVRKGMTVWFSTGTLSVAEFIPLTQ